MPTSICDCVPQGGLKPWRTTGVFRGCRWRDRPRGGVEGSVGLCTRVCQKLLVRRWARWARWAWPSGSPEAAESARAPLGMRLDMSAHANVWP